MVAPRAEVINRCAALALVVAVHAAWGADEARARTEEAAASAPQADVASSASPTDVPAADTTPPGSDRPRPPPSALPDATSSASPTDVPAPPGSDRPRPPPSALPDATSSTAPTDVPAADTTPPGNDRPRPPPSALPDATSSAAPTDVPTADTAPPGSDRPRPPPSALPATADVGAAGPATTPLKPWWLPLVLPVNLLAPGVGQLLRGDTAAGRRMLTLAGGLLAGALAGGVFLGATGASDVSAAVGVPLVVVGLGGFFSLGAIDAIGTFSDAHEDFPEGVRGDAWNARWRAGLSFQVAPSSPSADRPALGAFGQARFARWLVTAEAGTLPGVDEWWLSAGGGARLVRYGELSDAAGLWLETSVRHDAAGHLGFDATRWRVSAVSTLPLGVVSERFGRITSILRLGLDPTWVHYRATNTSSFELPLSGGFEVRWAMVDWLRAYAGYEHARDGLVGGNYLGFLGVLYAGLEVQLPAHLVLDLRGQAGSPAAFFTTLEWRH